ncbi:MAG: hypothetical protein ACOC2Q_04220 [Spirochaetota bacterium]
MRLFDREAGDDTQLAAIIEGFGEEVQRKALVQYHPPDAGHRPLWGLLLLTRSALHVIYGHGENWATRMIHPSPARQEAMTIPKDTITAVDLPPPPTGIWRLLGSGTGIATVRTKEGAAIRLEVDDDGEALLKALFEA